MPSISLTVNLGSAQTGLTLTAKVYTGSSLSASQSMAESPASSGRYAGTFTSPATAASYDGAIQDAGGIEYGSFSFQTDSTGNQTYPSRNVTIRQVTVQES